MSAYWIGVDLDATLAYHGPEHTGHKYDPARIGDPIPAMADQVRKWLADGKEVRIFTARVNPASDGYDTAEVARRAIMEWTTKHFGRPISAVYSKDRYMTVLYDDRARQVQANTGVIYDHG